MCGIVGLIGSHHPDAELHELLTAMCGRIRHRGPDGEGRLVEPFVAMGMRRLSIIDLAGGAQPIGSEDGQVQVVFNGEIYNHRLLRRELERAGHVFRTHADTEVIVHGYEEWGHRVLDRLRGMFAIALWDRPRQRVLLARDRLGIKPLYLWRHEGAVAFASELKALEILPGFPAVVDPLAVTRYLAFGYVPEPLAIWAGVEKLAPGHYLEWTRDADSRIVQWWSPAVTVNEGLGEEEATREVRRLLEDAVACHLESEVPLGAFLSGGIDSSAVVAQMQRLMDRPVETFTVGFAEEAFDEAPHAAQVAKAIGTAHTEQTLRPDIDALIDELVLAFDEPFADSSALPTWLVSRLARGKVTVALSGDGGDELFAGYTRYGEVLDRPDAPLPLRRLAGLVGRTLPPGAHGRNFLLDSARTAEGRFASTVALPLLIEEGGTVQSGILSGDPRVEHLLDDLFAQTRGRDLGARMALVDVMSYLPGDILTKVDRMSMRVSLEARVPLLDHHFAEFALSLPHALKRRGGMTKWIFRRAIEGLVPASVLTKRKQGFGVPIGQWMKGPLKDRLAAVADPRSPIYAFCDVAATARVLDEHRRGRRDHGDQLWRLLVLHLWLSAHRS